MNKLTAKLLIALYQGLPEWVVRNVVFLLIGIALGVGFLFLTLRPNLRRARRALLTRR